MKVAINLSILIFFIWWALQDDNMSYVIMFIFKLWVWIEYGLIMLVGG